MASAACINMEEVPVEFRVATTLFAMMALFPIPVTTTRPWERKMRCAVSEKSLPSLPFKARIEAASIESVSSAARIMAVADNFKIIE